VSELTTMLNEAFDTASEEASPDFEPLPKGSYTAFLLDAKVGPLKSRKGQAVQATWQIEDGEHAGRHVWDRIIVQHDSAEAMKFGRRKLKDIAVACGVTEQITDLSVLLNKPCTVFVKIETDESGEYPPKNRVTRVKPLVKTEKANGSAKPDLDDEIPSF
jgi:hypothetical protein